MQHYEWVPLVESQHSVQFGGNRHFGSGYMFLICQMISQDYVIQES